MKDSRALKPIDKTSFSSKPVRLKGPFCSVLINENVSKNSSHHSPYAYNLQSKIHENNPSFSDHSTTDVYNKPTTSSDEVKKYEPINNIVKSPIQNPIFHAAIASENFLLIKGLLKYYKNIHEIKNHLDETPINFAVRIGKILSIQHLLKCGFKISPNVDITPLQNTLTYYKDYGSLHRLIEMGMMSKNNNNVGCGPIHLAVYENNFDMVNFLLHNQVNVNLPDIRGDTPLHLAVQRQNTPIIELLLKNNADPLKVNFYGFTPWHYAYGISNPENINLIKHYVELKSKNGELNFNSMDTSAILNYEEWQNQKILGSDLYAATARQDEEEVRALLPDIKLSEIEDAFCNSVYFAITHNNLNLLKLLSQKCGNYQHFTELFKKRGVVPLALAMQTSKQEIINFLVQNAVTASAFPKSSKQNNELLFEAVRKASPKMIDAAISHGAQINSIDDNGSSPLHIACALNSEDVTKLLLFYQADPNIQDVFKQTPLHVAAEKRHVEIAELLLNAKADAFIVDFNGFNSVHYAHIDDLRKLRIPESVISKFKVIDEEMLTISEKLLSSKPAPIPFGWNNYHKVDVRNNSDKFCIASQFAEVTSSEDLMVDTFDLYEEIESFFEDF